MLSQLKPGLGVEDDQIYPVDGLLDLADVDEIAALDRPELKDEPWRPVTQPRLAFDDGPGDLFSEVRRGDVLVHLPYESFGTSVEAFVRAAARDPDVIGLKTTVYRTSDDSPLVPALIEAAESGKQSVCLVELQARFDERRNIEWSRALERAGVHVVYGYNLKIHAKATLIVRREANGLKRYVHVGTGNYHALTARTYEDAGLFSADEELPQTSPISSTLTGRTATALPQGARPLHLRARLIEEIRRVASGSGASARRSGSRSTRSPTRRSSRSSTKLHRRGRRSSSLARSLAARSSGLSENIRVAASWAVFSSSRVFVLEAGAKSTYLMGSADLMPRNLDNRLEIVVPGGGRADPAEDLSHVRRAARRQRPGVGAPCRQHLETTATKKDDRPLSAQAALMRSAVARARRRIAARRG